MDQTGDETSHSPLFDADRCLAGVRILLVDDSRSVSEAIRIMAIRSGARIRRADCLKSASRHLTIYRPDVLIVDLGLPDGNGANLAAKIVAAPDPRPAVLVISASEEHVTAQAAQAAGADGYIVKPISGFAQFQKAVLALLPEGSEARQDGIGNVTAGQIGEDALLHDLLNALDLLKEAEVSGDTEAIEFAAHFLLGVSRTIRDGDLTGTATALLASADTSNRKPATQAAMKVLAQKLQNGWAQAS